MIVSDLRKWEREGQRVDAVCLGARKPAQGDAMGSGVAAPLAATAAGGLVPSKTSLKSLVSFAPSVVAERRVNRLKKSVWASGHLHGIATAGTDPTCHFVTLTYARANAWSAKHVSDAVQAFRNWCLLRGYACRYTWVAEIQPKRLERTGESVVHYHMLAWLPFGVTMPHWDKPTRTPSGKVKAPFWQHGMTNSEPARSGVGYLMKYLSKLGEQSRFPKGLRLYGIGGLNVAARAVRSWLNLPEWVKRSHGVGDVMRHVKGLVLKATGEFLEPMYSIKRIPDGLQITALRPLPDKFHDGAYSTFPRVAC